MEFSIKASTIEKAKTQCFVVGVFENKQLSDEAKTLDTLTHGLIQTSLNAGDITGEVGSFLFLNQQPTARSRILLLGLGKIESFVEKHAKQFEKAVACALKAFTHNTSDEALLCFSSLVTPSSDDDIKFSLNTLIKGVVLASEQYAYDAGQWKSKKATPPKLQHLNFLVDKAIAVQANAALKRAIALAQGIQLTKDLGNAPSNICTPSYLAETAQQLAKDWQLKIEVLEKKHLERLKMYSFLSVTKGSIEPPKFIVLRYQGAKLKDAPYVLVGKGITFDSGGISLKPGEGMDEMKYDMCGAASVLGTMRAIAEMAPPINVTAIIATCENMPNGNASKPGDIVTSMSGQTIEILNTDAEGRLILCDALTYAERFNPHTVIDVATLTGACIIALGHIHSGLYSNNQPLADALKQAGAESGDTVWQMPLDEHYQEQLNSNFADMANIGGRPAGSVTAACFLSRFTNKFDRWAHLDIAGTAWKSGAQKGATGRPVSLLVSFLLQQAK